MIVGVLQVQIVIDGSQTLKDKRRVVQSLKQRVHNAHQVSIAEVDALDDHRMAQLGITMASNSVPHCQSTLDALVNELRQGRGFYLSDHKLEILQGH